MNTSQSTKELATALSKAQSKVKVADKSSVNPHFKSKYADLEEVWLSCRSALTSEGLSVVQGMTNSPTGWVLTTRLMHVSGEFIESETPLLLPTSPNMQHLGAATTYAKRISLMAIVGISVGEVDDDGEENRKQIEAQPKEDRTQSFQALFKHLQGIISQYDLSDELQAFMYAVCKKRQSDGVDEMKAYKADPELFVKHYKQFLTRDQNG